MLLVREWGRRRSFPGLCPGLCILNSFGVRQISPQKICCPVQTTPTGLEYTHRNEKFPMPNFQCPIEFTFELEIGHWAFDILVFAITPKPFPEKAILPLLSPQF
jgi:hypothetical protein